jgi:hypothetical protein
METRNEEMPVVCRRHSRRGAGVPLLREVTLRVLILAGLMTAACTTPASTPTATSAAPTASATTASRSLRAYITGPSADIVLSPADLPDSFGYRLSLLPDPSGCSPQTDCSERRLVSLYMPTILTRVEVFADVSPATERFAALVSSAPTVAPGRSGSVAVGDQAFTLITNAVGGLTDGGGPFFTSRTFIRVANSIHDISVTGYLSQMPSEYFTYVYRLQLARLTGAAASVPTPADPRNPLGYTVAFPNGWHVGVLSLAEQAPTGSLQPSIGNRLVTATVMAMNGAPSGVEAVAFTDFYIVGNSRVPRISTASGPPPNDLLVQSVAPGTSVTATVTFEVPVADSKFTVIYKPTLPRAVNGYPGVAWIGY